ncbi:MAG TPA: 1,4-beta-xylanase, partial [Cytophagales bacterium]|nr:1,4-beta-xylanase [Cytophagales bacterium]
MRTLIIVCSFLFSSTVWAQNSAHFGAPKFVPENGRLLVIGQDLGAVGGLDAYTNGYVDTNGQIPAGVT